MPDNANPTNIGGTAVPASAAAAISAAASSRSSGTGMIYAASPSPQPQAPPSGGGTVAPSTGSPSPPPGSSPGRTWQENWTVEDTPFYKTFIAPPGGGGPIGEQIRSNMQRVEITAQYNPEGLNQALATGAANFNQPGGTQAYVQAYEKASQEAVSRRMEERNTGLLISSAVADLSQQGLLVVGQENRLYVSPQLQQLVAERGPGWFYGFEQGAVWGKSLDFLLRGNELLIYPEGTRASMARSGLTEPIFLQSQGKTYLVSEKKGEDQILLSPIEPNFKIGETVSVPISSVFVSGISSSPAPRSEFMPSFAGLNPRSWTQIGKYSFEAKGSSLDISLHPVPQAAASSRAPRWDQLLPRPISSSLFREFALEQAGYRPEVARSMASMEQKGYVPISGYEKASGVTEMIFATPETAARLNTPPPELSALTKVLYGEAKTELRLSAANLLSQQTEPATLSGKALYFLAKSFQSGEDVVGGLRGSENPALKFSGDILGAGLSVTEAAYIVPITGLGITSVAEARIFGVKDMYQEKDMRQEAGAFGAALGYSVSGYTEMPRIALSAAVLTSAPVLSPLSGGASVGVMSISHVLTGKPITYSDVKTTFELGAISGFAAGGIMTGTEGVLGMSAARSIPQQLLIKSASGGLGFGSAGFIYSAGEDISRGQNADIQKAITTAEISGAAGLVLNPAIYLGGMKVSELLAQRGGVKYTFEPINEAVYRVDNNLYQVQLYGRGSAQTAFGKIQIPKIYGEASFIDISDGTSYYTGNIYAKFASDTGSKAARFPVVGTMQAREIGANLYSLEGSFMSGLTEGRTTGIVTQAFESGAAPTENIYYNLNIPRGQFLQQTIERGSSTGREYLLVNAKEGRFYQEVGQRYQFQLESFQTRGGTTSEDISRVAAKAYGLDFVESINKPTGGLVIKEGPLGFTAYRDLPAPLEFTKIRMDTSGYMLFVNQGTEPATLLVPKGRSFASYELSPVYELPRPFKSAVGENLIETADTGIKGTLPGLRSGKTGLEPLSPSKSLFDMPASFRGGGSFAVPTLVETTPVERQLMQSRLEQVTKTLQGTVFAQTPEFSKAIQPLVMKQAQAEAQVIGDIAASSYAAANGAAITRMLPPASLQREVKISIVSTPEFTRGVSLEKMLEGSITEQKLPSLQIDKLSELQIERTATVTKQMQNAFTKMATPNVSQQISQQFEMSLTKEFQLEPTATLSLKGIPTIPPPPPPPIAQPFMIPIDFFGGISDRGRRRAAKEPRSISKRIYAASVAGLDLGAITKNINKVFTGAEIRGLPGRRRKR